MSDDTGSAGLPSCNPDIYSRGTLALMVSMRAIKMEAWVLTVRATSGQSVDWHYSGGRALVLFIGDINRVRAAINKHANELVLAYTEELETLGMSADPGDMVASGHNGINNIRIPGGRKLVNRFYRNADPTCNHMLRFFGVKDHGEKLYCCTECGCTVEETLA